MNNPDPLETSSKLAEPLEYAAPAAERLRSHVQRRWSTTVFFALGVMLTTLLLATSPTLERGYSRAWLAMNFLSFLTTAVLIAGAVAVPFGIVLHLKLFPAERVWFRRLGLLAFFAGLPVAPLMRLSSALLMPPNEYQPHEGIFMILILVGMMIIYPSVLAWWIGCHSE